NANLIIVLVDRTDNWNNNYKEAFKSLMTKLVFKSPMVKPGDRLMIKAIHGAATADRLLFDAYLPGCPDGFLQTLFSDCKPAEAKRLQKIFERDIAKLSADLLNQDNCSKYSEIADALIELGKSLKELRKEATYAAVKVYVLSDLIENTVNF